MNSFADRRYQARSRMSQGWCQLARWTDSPLHEAGVDIRSSSFPPPVRTGSGSTGSSQPGQMPGAPRLHIIVFQTPREKNTRAAAHHNRDEGELHEASGKRLIA